MADSASENATGTHRDSETPKFDMRQLAGKRWPAPEWHFDCIEKESSGPESKERMMRVVRRMSDQQVPDYSGIDWDHELAAFGDIDFPNYYQQPFHSVPGGYLSEAAAVGDRCAMESIYQDAHPQRSMGVRSELATLIPADAKRAVELGAGTGDGAAAIARRIPQAEVTALEASPFMIIVGRLQNAEVRNLNFVQGFAEDTKLEDDSIDAIMITLVFHECPNKIKRDILAEAHRILRPGGALVLSDTPTDDLHDYRGFYEPYKEEWLDFDPNAYLREAGFVEIAVHDVAPPLWSRVAMKPH
jgi:SAM-dependent methyltransferase